jgi:lipopolysaccharide/colanic/teichoic acid biosynthesis glycosyltransferase
MKENPSHPSTTYCERFYRFFPFSRNNHNKLYLSIIRFFEIARNSRFVLLFVLMPFILFGNGINNKGKLFYTQERVGKDGVSLF